MIISKLVGGQGNQMFGYAIGRAMAIEKNTELIIDKQWIDDFERVKNVELFGLNCFELNDEIKIRHGNDRFRKYDTKINAKCLKIADQVIPYRFKTVLFERQFNYEPRILEIQSKDVYIKEGYWQSYKYFNKHWDVILKEFKFKDFVFHECRDRANRILLEENSVSIHIRRGDFEKNPEVAKIHGGICTLDYYLRSIHYIKSHMTSPIFYVFTDDLLWAKSNLSDIENVVFMENNTSDRTEEIGHRDKGYIDLYLMSLCKHNIIANSSFSWWGAWLNNNSNKIVIAPKKWFNDHRDTSDLIPENWVRM